MKLKKMMIKDFRQFYGNCEIEFTDGEKNVTIFLGENNAGKTGIYRALLFGLYGVRSLPQDRSDEKIHLVNYKALKENNVVTAKVVITIEYRRRIYIITRQLKGTIINDEVKEQEDQVKLDMFNEEGEFYPDFGKSEREIKGIVNSILDEGIKEFFFFDGEKIETLARVNKESRQEVKSGIINLMQIDKLEKIYALVANIYEKEKKRLTAKTTNNDLDIVRRKLEELIDNRNEYELIKREKIEELQAVKNEISNLEIELENNKKTMELFKEKELISKDIEHLRENLNENIKDLEDCFNNAHNLMMSAYYRDIELRIGQELSTKKDLIPSYIIENTLANGVCLCCNQEIDPHGASRSYLNEMLRNYKPSKVTNIMNMMLGDIKGSLQAEEKRKEKVKTILSDISTKQLNLDKLEKKHENLEQEISKESQSEHNLRNKDKRHKELYVSKGKLGVQLENLEENLNGTVKNIAKTENEYNEKLKKHSDNDYEIRRLEILDKFKRDLDEVHRDYIARIRKDLSEETTKNFKELIDYEDLAWVNRIIINEKYEIDIINENGLNITQDISQGQQLIVAIAFITSLAKVASKSKDKVEYPLFMDTAFGKLSRENRKNLIEKLPLLTYQWIPLFTDTDYTNFEKEIFLKENKVGKIYSIRKISSEESILEEMQIY